METLAHINAEDGITVLVSLHQVDMAVRYCKRVVALRHGEIVFDGPATGLTPGIFRQVYGADEEARLAMPGMAATTASVPEPLEPLLESPAM
jgi:phosphonate transport system ATP-binding protein